MEQTVRENQIVKTSIIGIITNVLLAAFKAGVGLLSNSIAITLDAVNNLSDALSSIITIIGTKLARKPADKKHPLGYGRIEYMSSTIIAFIVLYAGVTSFVESAKKIISPEAPDYKSITLIIVSVSVLVKIILGSYVKKMGKKLMSDSLVASGTDALLDSIISFSTLVAAVIFIFLHLNLEGILGAAISIIIIKSGFEMLGEAISRILGERIKSDISKQVKKTISEFDDVFGAYDLILHNYGPDSYIGSVHIEIPDYIDAQKIDELTREIQEKVYEQHRIIIAAVGIYAANTRDKDVIEMKDKIRKIVDKYESVLQLHAFYVDKENKRVKFDLIIDFDEENRAALHDGVVSEINKLYPGYAVDITMESDISD